MCCEGLKDFKGLQYEFTSKNLSWGGKFISPPPNHTPHAQISDEATVLRPPWMKWL